MPLHNYLIVTELNNNKMEKAVNKKEEMKKYISEIISKRISSTQEKFIKRHYRRIETIIRASINRLSYELKMDGNAIYLVRDNKKIIIEHKSNCEYWKQSAFNNATMFLDDAKEIILKSIEESAK